MNSIQRVLAALTFGKTAHGVPDRVPLLPVPLLQGALVHGCSPAEYFQRPAQHAVDAQLRLSEMLDGLPDAVAGIPHVIEDVTAFGIRLRYDHANSTPNMSGLLLSGYDEIQTLRAPDPTASAELRRTLEVITGLRRRIGDEKVVIGAAIAPFSLPSMLMGTERWMRLLYTEDLRRRHLGPLLDVCVRFVQTWANAMIDAGAHVVVLADGMASASIISGAMFDQHARQPTKETIAGIRGLVAYEPVGAIEPFVEKLGDLGAVAILIGEEDDITSCKRRLGGRAALIGNLNNMKLRRWSPARAELEAKRAIAAGMPGYGFALANQGPELPFDVDPAVVAAICRAADLYGRYDADARRAA